MAGNFFSQYTVAFDKDEVIYEQGEAGNCMFIIKEGEVKLFKIANEIEEEMATLAKGDFFGELSILEHSPRGETVKATEACSLVVIHRPTFVKMIKSNMEIAIRMLQKLSTKMRQSDEKIDMLVSRLSVMESQQHTTQPNFRPPVERKMIGKLISLSSNRTFILDQDRNLIGRFDPVTGIKPEVDLTYEDDTRSVSRRHAVIFRKNNQFFVQEEIGVLNGTYVNGNKSSSNNQQLPLKDQDMVNIGMLAFKFYMVNEDEA